MNYVLVSFETPHHTIKADKALGEIGMERAVYPIPREISRDCGMGLRLRESDLDRALRLFQEKGILHKNVFHVTDTADPSLIERLQKNRQDN